MKSPKTNLPLLLHHVKQLQTHSNQTRQLISDFMNFLGYNAFWQDSFNSYGFELKEVPHQKRYYTKRK